MKTKIKSIGLQNFQTIGDYQEILLGDLNFIYGPNSSGKSSIIDAIALMRDFWGVHGFKGEAGVSIFEQDGLPSIFRKNIRRFPNGSWGKDDFRIVISVEVNTESDVVCDDLYEISTEIRGGNFSAINYFGLSLGGQALFQVFQNVNDDQPAVLINYKHPFYKKIPGAHLFGGIIDYCDTHPNLFKKVDGWIEYHGLVFWSEDKSINASQSVEVEFFNEIDSGIIDRHELDRIEEALDDFGYLCKKILSGYGRLIFEALDVECVSASRTVPTNADLRFYFENFPQESKVNYGSDGSLSNFPSGFEKYRDLAYGASIRAFAHDFYSLQGKMQVGLEGQESNEWESDPRIWSIPLDRLLKYRQVEFLDRINETLINHLLLDSTYQVVAELHVVRQLTNILSLIGGERNIYSLINNCPVIADLKLRDSNGNIFDFSDVGSGIGYMLPVLCAINSGKETLIIQQPELHLHPAIQGALCDVFIEAANQGKQILIESHSEHAVLRALRRVRETTKGRHTNGGLNLSPERTSVLYFEPSQDSGSKIRTIRVSDDGDFIDRWPGGFFEERDGDLFDE